jgi:hypothetical protein
MDSDSQPPPILSWQFVMLIAATLGIIMSRPGTLPLSPADDEKAEAGKATGNEGNPALSDSRLWGDPYGAPRGAGLDLDGANPIIGTPGVNESRLERIRSGQICVMPVILRGDTKSEEAHEMRTQFRIATENGLGADGFTPDDPNHLMWVRISLCGGQPESVPVEWFLPGTLPRLRRSPYEAVLVVWLRDGALFDRPLEQLRWIRSQLDHQLSARCLIGTAPPAFRVIGPYWSGTLADILNEDLRMGQGITFYSSSATMADGVLEILAPQSDSNRPFGRQRLTNPDSGPVLVNLTCTDEQLSESLINELELRGVKPGAKDSRIAIISDWDTDFGRALPLTFAAKYRQWKNASETDRKNLGTLDPASYRALNADDASSWPAQILRVCYLSGVEGSLRADDSRDKKPKDESKTAPGSNSSAISLQRAEGEHQIDYIARLGRIFSERIDERNVGSADRGKLVAIGVLGADVYDKLLLIQALRPIFKEAVFFTDTLDARFMDPIKAIPFTRNLVISASYGFDLFRNFQVGVPPFRSTGQTGVFLAVQIAAAGDRINMARIAPQLRPLRFEIGRIYPNALNIPDKPRPHDYKDDLNGAVDKFYGLLHPPEAEFFPSLERLLTLYLRPIIYAIICMVMLYLTVMFVDGGRIQISIWKKRRPLLITASIVGLAAVLSTVGHFYDGIEPATWIQGISIWPTEFIRILAFAFGLVSLLVCHSKVRKSRIQLAQLFGTLAPEEILSPKGSLWKRFRMAISRQHQPVEEYICTFAEAAKRHNWLARAARSASAENPAATASETKSYPKPEEFVVAEELWRDACERSTVFGRNARTTAMTLFFFLAMLCLGLATHFPSVPYRGQFSMVCDSVTVFVASLMLIYLMFWVVDETHICLRFIKKLGAPELTIWPPEVFDSIPSLRPAISSEGISNNEASSYIDVCFIGKLSREAVPLIILPFVVLTLMIIARWDYFANWRWDPLILAVFGIDSTICVCCAVKLRNAAVSAKERAIRQISRAASAVRAGGKPDRADALDSLRELMEQNRDGAFVPWHQQPFVSALLLPFGGTGGLNLIEYLLSRP